MPDSYSFLAQRMVEFGIIPDVLRVEAEKVLRRTGCRYTAFGHRSIDSGMRSTRGFGRVEF